MYDGGLGVLSGIDSSDEYVNDDGNWNGFSFGLGKPCGTFGFGLGFGGIVCSGVESSSFTNDGCGVTLAELVDDDLDDDFAEFESTKNGSDMPGTTDVCDGGRDGRADVVDDG